MKLILVYSGGLDSTVLLYDLLAQHHTVKALSFHYGQKHRKELDCAQAICSRLAVEHKIVDLQSITPLLEASSLTNPAKAIPETPYDPASLKSTLVPNRNMIFLSLAAAWAISSQFEAIAYAAHGSDHALYPDCREAFAHALEKALQLADWSPLSLVRPFTQLHKPDIVQLGAKLQVPFEATWSCYKGEALHCGRCGTCIQRRHAFLAAQVPDPTPYPADIPKNF